MPLVDAMYIRHFGLKEAPFSIAPDPRYLYLSRRHQEALAHLIYGVTEGGGFVQLIGDVGTGKTMLIRALLERLPSNVDVALILYPILSVREFICAICDELQLNYARENATLKSLIDTLNAFLLDNHAKGRRTVLIIDEAQGLSRDVLEQLRLLTNLETNKEKLLQILLVGQPELGNMLAQDDLRQLSQRITARYSLKSLFPHETSDYIAHRCRVAGAKNQLFTRSAMRCVHKLSGGVPRVINMICDRALLGTYARAKARANSAIVRRAAGQVGLSVPRSLWSQPGLAAATVMIVALFMFGWQVWPLMGSHWQGSAVTTPAPEAASKPAAENIAQAPPSVEEEIASAQEVETPPELEEPEVHMVQRQAREVPSVEPEPGPKLTQLLADPDIPTDTESALAGLFAHWGLDYAKLQGSTGCARAIKSGLQCIFRSGTWNNLRHLNRPAVIELVDEQGQRHHVLVAALNGDEVSSEFAGEQYNFRISEVDRYWYGQYLLLWKPPLNGRRLLRRGMQGRSVLWLRNTLARSQGEPAATKKSDIFDSELEAQVKAFQRKHQLTDDGIVGRLTLLQLNTYDPVLAPPLLWKVSAARTS
ncbi:MAG: AAA family ATPase [Acidiferrobacterales bacterium]